MANISLGQRAEVVGSFWSGLAEQTAQINAANAAATAGIRAMPLPLYTPRPQSEPRYRRWYNPFTRMWQTIRY